MNGCDVMQDYRSCMWLVVSLVQAPKAESCALLGTELLDNVVVVVVVRL